MKHRAAHNGTDRSPAKSLGLSGLSAFWHAFATGHAALLFFQSFLRVFSGVLRRLPRQLSDDVIVCLPGVFMVITQGQGTIGVLKIDAGALCLCVIKKQ